MSESFQLSETRASFLVFPEEDVDEAEGVPWESGEDVGAEDSLFRTNDRWMDAGE